MREPTRPAASDARGLFDSKVGCDAMANFDQQLKEIALEESALGRQARLALRLQRDKAPENEIRRAVRPFMLAYVKLLMAPADKLERDEQKNFVYPIVLPKARKRSVAD
jgi:hypothetical protein